MTLSACGVEVEGCKGIVRASKSCATLYLKRLVAIARGLPRSIQTGSNFTLFS